MTHDEEHPGRKTPNRDLRSFGRRHGRKVSPRQAALLHDLLPQISVDLTKPFSMRSSLPRASDPEGQTPPLWLEIGFGGAEHLIWQAEHHPDVTIIGCEPFEEGVVKALAEIEAKRLSNVRLHADDARPLVRWLTPASLSRCFILFPDPWPKKRHAKRRLVTPSTLAGLARVMKPGAELRIGTDIGPYARSVLIAIATDRHFDWTARSAADWRQRPNDWPQTRYEAKGLREGRRCYYLTFRRNDRP